MDISLGGVVGVPVVVPVIKKKALIPTYTAISNGAIASPTTNKVYVTGLGSSARIDIVWGGGTATVSTANLVTFTMPAGMTIDTSLLAGTGLDDVGAFDGNLSTAGALKALVASSTTVTFKKQGANANFLESDLGSGWILSGSITVPIVEWATYDTVAYGAGQATAIKSGIVMGGTVPGKTDGTATAAGYLGEMFGTLSSGTGGSTYKASTTTAWTSTASSVVSVTLNKGIYLVSVMGKITGPATAGNANWNLRIGGTAVTTTMQNGYSASGELAFSIPAIPIVISTDATVVAFFATASGGTSTGTGNEMYVVRIG